MQLDYWKQGLQVRAKIKHLFVLSSKPKMVTNHGVNCKSQWQVARTSAVQQALSNVLMNAQGLFIKGQPVLQGSRLYSKKTERNFVERAN